MKWIVRQPEWSNVFRYNKANNCEHCGIRICEIPQEDLDTDPPTLPDGTVWGCCPHQTLINDPTTYQSILRAIELWRHWDKGNLSALVTDASDGLSRMILWVDEEVQSYKSYLETAAYERARSEGNK